MTHKGMSLGRWAPVLLVIGGVGLISCPSGYGTKPRSVDVVSRTEVSGTVNGSAVEGRIVANLNIGRGGRSTCTFVQLPPTFTPGTFATHG